MTTQFPPSPPTLAQCPPRATDYYKQSVRSYLFKYIELGRDDVGRRVYQKELDGKGDGYPRALLTYAEYKKEVQRAHESARNTPIGVQRWTRPYFRNGSPIGPLSLDDEARGDFLPRLQGK